MGPFECERGASDKDADGLTSRHTISVCDKGAALASGGQLIIGLSLGRCRQKPHLPACPYLQSQLYTSLLR